MTQDENSDQIFASDTGNGRIKIYSENFQNVQGTIGFGELQKPSGIDISPVSGDIYVIDAEARSVRVYGKDGTSKGVFVENLPLFQGNITCREDLRVHYTDDIGVLPGTECIPVGIVVDNS